MTPAELEEMAAGEARRRRQEAAMVGLVVAASMSGRGSRRLIAEWLGGGATDGGVRRSGLTRDEYLAEFDRIAGDYN